jgi:hypothetical protein
MMGRTTNIVRPGKDVQGAGHARSFQGGPYEQPPTWDLDQAPPAHKQAR